MKTNSTNSPVFQRKPIVQFSLTVLLGLSVSAQAQIVTEATDADGPYASVDGDLFVNEATGATESGNLWVDNNALIGAQATTIDLSSYPEFSNHTASQYRGTLSIGNGMKTISSFYFKRNQTPGQDATMMIPLGLMLEGEAVEIDLTTSGWGQGGTSRFVLQGHNSSTRKVVSITRVEGGESGRWQILWATSGNYRGHLFARYMNGATFFTSAPSSVTGVKASVTSHGGGYKPLSIGDPATAVVLSKDFDANAGPANTIYPSRQTFNGPVKFNDAVNINGSNVVTTASMLGINQFHVPLIGRQHFTQKSADQNLNLGTGGITGTTATFVGNGTFNGELRTNDLEVDGSIVAQGKVAFSQGGTDMPNIKGQLGISTAAYHGPTRLGPHQAFVEYVFAKSSTDDTSRMVKLPICYSYAGGKTTVTASISYAGSNESASWELSGARHGEIRCLKHQAYGVAKDLAIRGGMYHGRIFLYLDFNRNLSSSSSAKIVVRVDHETTTAGNAGLLFDRLEPTLNPKYGNGIRPISLYDSTIFEKIEGHAQQLGRLRGIKRTLSTTELELSGKVSLKEAQGDISMGNFGG